MDCFNASKITTYLINQKSVAGFHAHNTWQFGGTNLKKIDPNVVCNMTAYTPQGIINHADSIDYFIFTFISHTMKKKIWKVSSAFVLKNNNFSILFCYR